MSSVTTVNEKPQRTRRWRKRTIALTALAIALILGMLVNVLVDRNRQQNIFDEIYWDTKGNYVRNSSKILKIQGVNAPNYRFGIGDFPGPSYYCKTDCLDQGGEDVGISFMTEVPEIQEFTIAFDHHFTPETSLTLVNRYDINTRTLTRFFYAPKPRPL